VRLQRSRARARIPTHHAGIDVAALLTVRSLLLDSALSDPVPPDSGLFGPITIEAPLGSTHGARCDPCRMRIAILGPVLVEHDGAPREVAGGRLQALLARLALDAGRAVSPAALAEAVWDGDPPRDEQHALQSLISRLRRALGDAALVVQDPAGYRLAVAPEEVDVARFQRLARDGAQALAGGDAHAALRSLTEALGLWHGVPAADALRLEDLRLQARVDRLAASARLGHAAHDVPELAELAAGHPLDERIAALRVRALAAAGRQADALAAYEQARAALDTELGAVPSAELQAAHLAVLRGDPPAPAPRRARGNLPAARTSFVGRDDDLRRAEELLARHRLVTLVGTGGAGKTRLALEVAARADVPAWLVELAPLGDADALAPAMLGALGLSAATLPDRRAMAADAESRLLDALSSGDTLIVLDNCEHIVVPAARLADRLLAGCPGLRILATSREPLAIGGEALAPVGPLDTPAAVALFADRAASAAPGVVLDEGLVADVCRRIDGLPLAIELAAARLRSMPLDQLAARLHDRFRLLTGGSRAAAGRQRTLRAVVDWSWDLLGEPERRVARRLSVFSGGATLDAAEAVCAGDGVAADEVFEVLCSLVDRSLLQVDGAGEPHWRMLETIREYAEEEAERAGELLALRQAHAGHFARLVAEADRRLRGAEQVPWLARLRADRDNVLSALRFLADMGDGHAALRMALGLLWFWALTDGREEAVTWLRLALAADTEPDPLDALLAGAIVAWAGVGEPAPAEDGGMERALALLAEADLGDRPLLAVAAPIVAAVTGHERESEHLLARLDTHADPWVRAMSPFIHAQIAENEGRLDEMAGRLDVALERFRATGDRWGTAAVLSELAALRMVGGDLAGAEVALSETEALLGELGASPNTSMIMLRRADLRARQGDVEGARAVLAGALEATGPQEDRIFVRVMLAALTARTGDRDAARALREQALRDVHALRGHRPDHAHQRAIVFGMSARMVAEEGDLERARELLVLAFDATGTARDLPIAGRVGEASAVLALQLGRPADAAEMLGASIRLRGTEDASHPETAALLARLRDALDEEALTARIAAGRALDREAALARLDPATLG
jgi:predicted ATPase/DNA-binding SARP family transcriptional activator